MTEPQPKIVYLGSEKGLLDIKIEHVKLFWFYWFIVVNEIISRDPGYPTHTMRIVARLLVTDTLSPPNGQYMRINLKL